MNTPHTKPRKTKTPSHLAYPLLCSLLLLAACTTTPEPTPQPTPKTLVTRTAPTLKTIQLIEAENTQELTTETGAKLNIAQGWWVAKDGPIVHLEDPEREMKLWFVDNKEATLQDAINSAWQSTVPNFKREIENEITPPPSGGWDKIHVITYKSKPQESIVIQAIAQRKNDVNYITLIHSPIAAAQRRGAQLQQIISSLKPEGLENESFKNAKAKPWTDESSKILDAFIQKVIQDLKIPGLAIAVLQDDKTVFERGYGITHKGGKPITPDTRFMIGSNSKSFTSLMMARLVDQGKLSWDTPMTKLMPSFRTGDPELTSKILAHHTMCACTGLPRQDLEFIFQYKNSTPELRLKELASMKPTTGFGETFQYSNPLVSAGGYASAQALHPRKSFTRAYEDALRDTILRPLGLKATSVHKGKGPRGAHAIPHGVGLFGDYAPIPFSYEDAVSSVAPAGGLWSNLRDLSTVMRMELAKGKDARGKTFVSEENIMRRRQPSVKIGKDSHYGLAMMVSNKRDLLQVGHGGNTLGFTTLNDFFPNHNTGIIILSNAQGANFATSSIKRRIIELLFDEALPKVEKNYAFTLNEIKKRRDKIRPRVSSTPSPTWVNPLLGTYSNEALGSITLSRKVQDIIFDTGEWSSHVSMYEDNGVKLIMLDTSPIAGVTLIPQKDNTLLLDVGQQKYVFTKAP